MTKKHLIKWMKDNEWPGTAGAIQTDDFKWLEKQLKASPSDSLTKSKNSKYNELLKNYLRQHKLRILADEQ